MKTRNVIASIFLLAFFISPRVSGQDNPERQWPAYRGYMSSGILDNAGLPDSFDLQKNVNILWKTEIPGLGLSSPVIWGNKLFITTAVSKADKEGFKPGIYGDTEPVDDSSEHEWKVLCYDKSNGKMLWDRTSCKGIP
jgi:outer membrane protein assembly factor BamB